MSLDSLSFLPPWRFRRRLGVPLLLKRCGHPVGQLTGAFGGQAGHLLRGDHDLGTVWQAEGDGLVAPAALQPHQDGRPHSRRRPTGSQQQRDQLPQGTHGSVRRRGGDLPADEHAQVRVLAEPLVEIVRSSRFVSVPSDGQCRSHLCCFKYKAVQEPSTVASKAQVGNVITRLGGEPGYLARTAAHAQAKSRA